ncbi:hypothetical protein GCM10009839_80930 [Catenulispora yoronensis]|uniref:Uncharacterized protein n=1 Tax=Catenulispora yoronensis TaxID=450799 RepID=A0ABN2VCZ1_9ACTN
MPSSDEALVLSHWLEWLQMTELGAVVDDPAVDDPAVDDPAVWAPIQKISGT